MKNHKNLTKIKLKSKIVLSASMMISISIVLVGSLMFYDMYNQNVDAEKEKALAITQMISMNINGDDFKQLTTSLDKNEKAYTNLYETFDTINDFLGDSMVYTIADLDKDEYTYIVDGSKTVEIGYKQSKLDFSPEIKKSFENGEAASTEVYEVESLQNHYISAFSPIKDSNQNVVGVVEYDYNSSPLVEKLQQLFFKYATILLLIIGFVVSMTYIMLTRLFKPIGDLTKTISVIADGDLTVELNTLRKDEIGTINKALAKTLDSLQLMISSIKNSSNQITDISKIVLTSSTASAQASEHLTATTEEIASMCQTQTQVTSRTHRLIETISKDIENVFSQIDKTKQMTKDTLAITQNGSKTMSETCKQIEYISETVNDTTSRVSEFVLNIDKIQEILTTISNISNQTNLLALNATIEAARAGEQGKGFAVVADEIRKLAEESAIATNQIRNITSNITEQSKIILTDISKNKDSALIGSGMAQTANSSFDKIADSNNTLDIHINSLRTAITQIVNSLESINKEMKDLDEISNVIESNTESLVALSEEQMAESEEIKELSNKLNSSSDDLKTNIEVFKTNI